MGAVGINFIYYGGKYYCIIESNSRYWFSKRINGNGEKSDFNTNATIYGSTNKAVAATSNRVVKVLNNWTNKELYYF